ncbi:MAG: 16S rRNA (cytidine(1402)-2'-O)-methyltransferase [Desulfobacterium sp.]|nr:16S rRNA (cytidine(1402)-2'-O)-methyltransferase [Desulfobacterium sp.]
MNNKGNLYIVATPIGNLEDITIRAIKVLSEVDIIAAEDTRNTGKLLSYHNIKGKLVSYHEHNETQKAQKLIAEIEKGLSVAIVTDAGTPSVSDPGYRIVQAAIENNIQPIPIPGPSAAVTALSASGLPTDIFTVVGFLPKKKGKRLEQLEKLAFAPGTLIFYESPKRILQLLNELQDVFGERDIVFAREITKRYEEFQRGTISELIEKIEKKDAIKGECTLLVSGKSQTRTVCLEDLRNEITENLKNPGNTTAVLARKMAAQYGIPRKQIYQEILEITGNK